MKKVLKFGLAITFWVNCSFLYLYSAVFFSDSFQSGYYDTGLAFKSGGSSLESTGPSGDKLPTNEEFTYSGGNSLKVSWTSRAGGDWSALVIAPGFPFQDISQDDFLSFWLYTEDALSASELPVLYFEGAPGFTKSSRIPLSDFIAGLSAGNWTQILVPLSTYRDDPNQSNINFSQIKAIILGQNQADAQAHTLYIDEVRTLTSSMVNAPVQAPSALAVEAYDSHLEITWVPQNDPGRAGYHLYRSSDQGNSFSLYKFIPSEDSLFLDWLGFQDRRSFQYRLHAINGGGGESSPSNVAFGQTRDLSDEEWLDMVQRYTFRYFWDFAHPSSGMARERNTSTDLVTAGGSGFGIMAILVGMERGYIAQQAGKNRLSKIVTFLESADRFHGAWPHWMDGQTGAVVPFSQFDDGGDLVETAFLVQGILCARQYLDPIQDSILVDRLDQLWRGVEWNWYRKLVQRVLFWHWSPNYGWQINFELRGHNETHLAYILAIASPTHSIPASLYHEGWAGGNYLNGNNYYGWPLPVGPALGGPLFFAHYSYLGFDPRGKRDAYTNYFLQNRNHTRINRAWCIDNPRNHLGYGPNCWGLTASDNPFGYLAHEPSNTRDNGTITPTAALGSMPYTPVESMAALKHFYREYGQKLWGPMGFYDAFNPSENWFAKSYLAIDQGPIILMLENYRSALLWNTFMSSPEIDPALNAIGFFSDSTSVSVQSSYPPHFQAFPNPTQAGFWVQGFHGLDPIDWSLIDLTGRVITTGRYQPSSTQDRFFVPTQTLSSGLYILSFQQAGHRWQEQIRKE